jgi:hypothetical protein
MALIPLIELLKRLRFEGITQQEQAALLRNLRARRRELQDALRAVDRAMGSLARRPTRKKAAKRKVTKRTAKGR